MRPFQKSMIVAVIAAIGLQTPIGTAEQSALASPSQNPENGAQNEPIALGVLFDERIEPVLPRAVRGMSAN
jgi:hypothetical protein